MQRRVLAGVALSALLFGCPAPQEVKHRAEVRNAGGGAFELVPTEGQLPYCIVFTISEKKVIRQLTMNRDNKSSTARPASRSAASNSASRTRRGRSKS